MSSVFAARRNAGVGVCSLLAAAFLAGPSDPASAQSVAEFYKGKTLNIIIGYSAGGGFDIYARVLGKHIGKHIPGNPTVVPQNMPGAASLKATEYLYTAAPKDGTQIGTFSHTMPLAPLLQGAKFDAKRFEWLGSVTSDTNVCIAWHASPVKTWADLQSKPFNAGSTGKGSDPEMFIALFRNVFNLPVKLVSGYPGTADMVIATERGEIDGFCGISYSTLTSRNKAWLDERKVNILVQAALDKDASLPDVPLLMDYARDERQRQILTLIVGPQLMARPYAMPPGTPKDRADAVRAAFMATMKDPEFLAEAKQTRLDVNPITAKQILDLLDKVYATPEAVVKETIKALE